LFTIGGALSGTAGLTKNGTGTLTVKQEDAFIQYTGDSIAQIGTNTGSTAYNTANSAWNLAQIGTNTGTAAYNLGDLRAAIWHGLFNWAGQAP
jgi:hypothetical protein